MMLRFVRAITFDAFGPLDTTGEGGVTPFPAIFALEDSRIHICSSNRCDIIAHIEVPVDKKFSILTTLYIPNIYPNNSHIRFWWDLDNLWLGCKGDVVKNMILLEYGFNIQWSKLLLRIRVEIEWYANDFQIRFRLGESWIFDLKGVDIIRIFDIMVDDG